LSRRMSTAAEFAALGILRRAFDNDRAVTWTPQLSVSPHHGILILPPRPPGGNAPVSPAAAPEPGNTIDDEAWRRNSCSSRTARSTPTFAASPYLSTASLSVFASTSKLIGSGPMLVRI